MNATATQITPRAIPTTTYGLVGRKSITPRRRCGVKITPWQLRAADDGGPVTLHNRPWSERGSVRVVAETTSAGRAPQWMEEAVRILNLGLVSEDDAEATAKATVRRRAAARRSF